MIWPPPISPLLLLAVALLPDGQSAPKADPPILRATAPATVAGESADRKLVSIAKNVLALG